MPLQAFDQLCYDTARSEARLLEVKTPNAGVTPGRYLLREFYCTEPDCDCRRVLVQFLPMDGPPQVAASINYGWEKAKYYRKWSRDPDLWREMAGPTLERFAEQGPDAPRFLKIFHHIIKDHMLVAAFRRHYRLVKDKVRPPSSPEF